MPPLQPGEQMVGHDPVRLQKGITENAERGDANVERDEDPDDCCGDDGELAMRVDVDVGPQHFAQLTARRAR